MTSPLPPPPSEPTPALPPLRARSPGSAGPVAHHASWPPPAGRSSAPSVAGQGRAVLAQCRTDLTLLYSGAGLAGQGRAGQGQGSLSALDICCRAGHEHLVVLQRWLGRPCRGWHSEAGGMQPEGVREALKWHFVTQPDEGDLLTMSRKESLSWLSTPGCRTCVAWTGE